MKLLTDQERFSQIYLESGNEALFKEKYNEALASYLDALKYNPKSLDAWNNIGLAYYGLQEQEKAKDSWLKALVVDPKYSEAKTNLGALYLEQNKLHDAEREFKDVLRDLIYSKSHLVHYNLATIYLREGKPLLAEEHLSLAVKSKSSYCDAWLRLGYLASKRGDYTLAADRFKGATSGTCYNVPEAHYQMGQAYLRAGNDSGARSKFIELIKNFSSTEWARKAERDLSMLYRERK